MEKSPFMICESSIHGPFCKAILTLLEGIDHPAPRELRNFNEDAERGFEVPAGPLSKNIPSGYVKIALENGHRKSMK